MKARLPKIQHPKRLVYLLSVVLDGIGGNCEHRDLGKRAWCHTCSEYCYGVNDRGCVRCTVLFARQLMEGAQR